MIKRSTKVGYTHSITWSEVLSTGSMKGHSVVKSFPTTKDALPWHLQQMKTSEFISNIQVNKL